MLSALHEAPLVLIREEPSLVPLLARDACGVELPEFVTARSVSTDLTQAIPIERRADAVVTLEGAKGTVVAAFVIEVQLAVDRDKHVSWPLYLASVHARQRCPTFLVVVAPSESVALWARRPITAFHDGLTPIVVGPSQIPRVTAIEGAVAAPELALLSAFVHGNERGGDSIVETAMLGVASLDGRRAGDYADLALAVLGDRVRPFLEAVMGYPSSSMPMSDWAKGHYREGKAAGIRQVLFALIGARAIELSSAGRARIEACPDPDALEACVLRAAVATSEADCLPVFADKPPATD